MAAPTLKDLFGNQLNLLGTLGNIFPAFGQSTQIRDLENQIQGQITALEAEPSTADTVARVAALEQQLATLQKS